VSGASIHNAPGSSTSGKAGSTSSSAGSAASASSASSGAASNHRSGDGQDKPSPAELYHRLAALIGEYKEYLAYYLGAKKDGIVTSLRNTGILAALGVVGLIAFSAVITTAVVLLLVGAAWGLGVLLSGPYGPRIWAGALIVGGLILGALVAGVLLGLSMLNKSFRRRTVEKYEQRQQWQRGQFGRNVQDAAQSHDQAQIANAAGQRTR
jgi:hypothetical protein